MPCIVEKTFHEGYNFALDLTSILGLYKSYKHPKWEKSQFWEFRDSQLRNPEKNDICVEPHGQSQKIL
jgi:hypothetical protein